MKEKSPKHCFVISSADIKLTNLEEIFKSLNVRISYALSSDEGHLSLYLIKKMLSEADFVCAIIPKPSTTTNILFELGLVEGSKIPLLIIIDPDEPLIFKLQGLNYIRCRIDDIENLKAYIVSFIKYEYKGKNKSRIAPVYHKTGASVNIKATHRAIKIDDKLLLNDKIKHVPSIENAVFNIFQNYGYITVESPSNKIYGPDMAIWINEMENIINNPIVIDIKYGSLTKAKIDESVLHLRKYMNKSHTMMGLIIYKSTNNFKYSGSIGGLPIVIPLDFEQLLDLLNKGIFINELLNQRNKIVHFIE
jgi:hypothetical protein